MTPFFVFMLYTSGALKTYSILRPRGSSLFVSLGCSLLWPATLGEWLAAQIRKNGG